MQKQEGGFATFSVLYSSITFTVCACGESKVSFITFRIFSILSQPFKTLIHIFIVLKPDIICTFLIYSGSLQKMLTALFNLIYKFEIHRKVNRKLFLSAQARCFLVLKRFQKRQVRPTLTALPYFFLHIFEAKVSHFYLAITC